VEGRGCWRPRETLLGAVGFTSQKSKRMVNVCCRNDRSMADLVIGRLGHWAIRSVKHLLTESASR
jgi:hypothetical protein